MDSAHLSNSKGKRAEDGEDGLMHSTGQEGQFGKLAKVWRVQLILHSPQPCCQPVCGCCASQHLLAGVCSTSRSTREGSCLVACLPGCRCVSACKTDIGDAGSSPGCPEADPHIGPRGGERSVPATESLATQDGCVLGTTAPLPAGGACAQHPPAAQGPLCSASSEGPATVRVHA